MGRCVQSVLLLLLLLMSVPARAEPHRHTAPGRSLRWADRLYAEASTGLDAERGPCSFYTRRNFIAAAVAYRQVLHRWGESAPARLGLARTLEQLAAYAPASAAYAAVLRSGPHGREARAGLRRVRPLASAAAAVLGGTEGKVTLVQALDVSRPGERPCWLMLSAPAGEGVEWSSESFQLHLVRSGDAEATLVWENEGTYAKRAPGPGREWQQEFDLFGVEQAYLRRLSPSGASRPLIGLVVEAEIAGSADSQLRVFHLTGKRLDPVWAAGGTIGIFLTDLDRDGWREVGIWDEVGWDMPHAAQPRWIDRYVWDGHGYRLANVRFASTFHEVKAHLYGARDNFPADPEVVARLGEIHEMDGRRRAAEYAYRWALAEYRRRMRRDRDSVSYRHELATLEARLGQLRTRRLRIRRTARALPSRFGPG